MTTDSPNESPQQGLCKHGSLRDLKNQYVTNYSRRREKPHAVQKLTEKDLAAASYNLLMSRKVKRNSRCRVF